ncbi:MAG: tRNA pseudouridine synthase A [Candidatus Omnitrophica bacterium ADurb.Bin205]|nr:MAG: tRNA pseudouridine synthase A [Candidatus Omnitrophica bacterium ADurb.Bin205]
MPDKKKLRNIKLVIEYNGRRYCGWQSQPNTKRKSIQKAIEDVLFRLLGNKVKLIASGRTDAGVHALAQVANFYTRSRICAERLKLGLNGLLPCDIKVSEVKEAPFSFHSRFSSKSKLYRYTILNRGYSSPLMEGSVFFYPHPLDIKAMRRESRVLLGRHNFRSFQASLGKDKNPVKVIKKLAISRKKDLIFIDIEADGFLYNMIRNIVGTLIMAGNGKLPKGGLKNIMLAKDRRRAGQTAPACGLCLIKVGY